MCEPPLVVKTGGAHGNPVERGAESPLGGEFRTLRVTLKRPTGGLSRARVTLVHIATFRAPVTSPDASGMNIVHTTATSAYVRAV